MKLGDTIYVYSPYGRHDRTYEEHLARWSEYKIVEETRVSWIAKRGSWCEVKIDKKTEQCRDKTQIATSAEEILKRWEDRQWVDSRYRIAEKIQRSTDVDLLKKIAELVGYVHEEPK
jgi:hypothetical protein